MEKELYLVSATKHFFDRNKIVKASSLFEIGINFFPTWFYECFKTLKLYEINRPLLFFHCLVFISLMNVRYGKLKIVLIKKTKKKELVYIVYPNLFCPFLHFPSLNMDLWADILEHPGP